MSDSSTFLARAGNASITHDQDGERQTWTVSSNKIRLRLRWFPGTGLRITRIESPEKPTVTGSPNDPPFALNWAGAPVPLERARLLDASATATETHVTLALQLTVESLRITVHLRCHDNLAVIEQWLSVTSTVSGTLSDVIPLSISLRSPETPTLTTIAGVQRQGGWRPDSGDYRSFRLEERPLTDAFSHESGLRSTWDETPWFALTNFSDGVFSGLIYSGRWRLNAAYDATTAHVSLAPVGYEPTLQPGQTWTSPISFIGISTGDLDEAAAAQYDFHRHVISPPLPADFPWVQYNTWYSYYCDLTANQLLEEAKIAADLGIEVFYIDAGWWEGNPPSQGSLFSSGLGMWRENRAKFPNGVETFMDDLRALGLRPGIWVEPERVDLRTATLSTWRPDWIATTGGKYVRADWPGNTDTAWLCFGHPEVQAWATSWISDLVASLGLRWLKWDSNYWGVCDNPDHGHDPSAGEAAQLAGVHAVMDALRARFPNLIIENCAGGGTRLDFAMAAHTHTAWVSDATDPAQRVRFHLHGAGYLFPPSMLNSWLVESTFESLEGHDMPEPVLRAIVRSRMLGAFGISSKMVNWTEPTRRILREEIAAYKTYRHLLKDGYLSHLTTQPTLDSPRFTTPDTWEAYQFRSPDASEAVILAFRNASTQPTFQISPKNLDPEATYRITIEDGTVSIHPGQTLVIEGFTIELPPLASARISLRREFPRPNL